MILGIDGRELVPGRGTGIKRFLSNLLLGVMQERPAWKLRLYSSEPMDRPAGLECEEVVMPSGPRLYWEQVELPGRLRRDRVDFFFSPYLKAPLRLPCPAAVTVHDLLYLSQPRYWLRPRDLCHNLYQLAQGRLSCRRAARVFTVSRYSRTELLSWLGCSPEKVVLLRLGVEPSFHPGPVHDDAGVWKRHGLKPGYVLAVANEKPHKNLDRLRRCHAALPLALQQQHPLVLVGTGKTQEGCPWQRALGPCSEHAVPALYRGADLVAVLSLAEGFGLPVVEAYASGVAVLCSANGALREVGSGGAWMVDPRDDQAILAAMTRMLLAPTLREECVARGLQSAASYSWTETAKLFVRALEEASSL